jgi:hypothetical protein
MDFLRSLRGEDFDTLRAGSYSPFPAALNSQDGRAYRRAAALFEQPRTPLTSARPVSTASRICRLIADGPPTSSFWSVEPSTTFFYAPRPRFQIVRAVNGAREAVEIKRSHDRRRLNGRRRGGVGANSPTRARLANSGESDAHLAQIRTGDPMSRFRGRP